MEFRYWLKHVDITGDKQRNIVKMVNMKKLNEKRLFMTWGLRVPI